MSDENAYLHTRIGEVELTVQGNEDETTEDLENTFSEKLAEVIEEVRAIEEEDCGGVYQ